jgi:tagaturonate reductase
MPTLPETILQFGSGRFLRGFADLFVHQANEAGQELGRVVVVQSTGAERARLLQERGGRYRVAVRGLVDGQVVDRLEESASISRALVAETDWPQVLALARSPSWRWLVSNTAEAGYDLEPTDHPQAKPPRSFPARLLLLLYERYQAGLPGVAVIPCELFEHNAERLRRLLQQLAGQWQLPVAFRDWLEQACTWHNTLVDRIVCAGPAPGLEDDPLGVVTEPYALWAIETPTPEQPFFLQHPAVIYTRDVQPYFLRKVRILNAAHTALVQRALPRGLTTVGEALADGELAAWLQRLLLEEIVPVLEGRVAEPARFAQQVLERFRNPFLVHRLSDIAQYHEAKVRIRLLPTREEYVARFGRRPPLLEEVLAASGVTA